MYLIFPVVSVRSHLLLMCHGMYKQEVEGGGK